MSTPTFTPHHATVSVRDLDASIAFYARLGFKIALRWTSETGHLQLAHLVHGPFILEFFAYAKNTDAEHLDLTVGNDLERIGVRHVGLRVDDLAAARDHLITEGCEVSELRRGRTKIDFFYVRDPDGNWVEIVKDTRALDPDNVTHLHEGARSAP